MTILGIDPGLASTGFGAIKGQRRCTPSVLRCGFIRTSAKAHVSDRLSQIYSDVNLLVSEIKPDLIAIENVFSAVRYPRAGILLGGVLGAVYIAAKASGIRTMEITPREVKNALVGHGSAGKEQIKTAVRRMLQINSLRSFHAADALAVALAAYYRGGLR